MAANLAWIAGGGGLLWDGWATDNGSTGKRGNYLVVLSLDDTRARDSLQIAAGYPTTS